jgi:hypothetical protein
VDETYVGGKQRGHKGKFKSKDVVMGIRERGGDLRLFQVADNSAESLGKHMKENISPKVEKVMTDEWRAYPPAMIAAGIHGSKHETIKHMDKVYVRGNVHTNTIESAFSLFKRGVIGSFHQISIKHLQRYLNEFSYRFNRREDDEAFMETVRRLAGFKPLTFSKLTAEKA